MCDYSLEHVASRAAKVDDLFVTTQFKKRNPVSRSITRKLFIERASDTVANYSITVPMPRVNR